MYGVPDEKRRHKLLFNSLLNPKTKIISGALEKEFREILVKFF
jgi:hypothetical protein